MYPPSRSFDVRSATVAIAAPGKGGEDADILGRTVGAGGDQRRRG